MIRRPPLPPPPLPLRSHFLPRPLPHSAAAQRCRWRSRLPQGLCMCHFLCSEHRVLDFPHGWLLPFLSALSFSERTDFTTPHPHVRRPPRPQSLDITSLCLTSSAPGKGWNTCRMLYKYVSKEYKALPPCALPLANVHAFAAELMPHRQGSHR